MILTISIIAKHVSIGLSASSAPMNAGIHLTLLSATRIILGVLGILVRDDEEE
jgi:hypothetical protein